MKKTGLAKRMRAWMRGQKQPFTWQELYICVDIPGGPDRKQVYTALNDFIKRGEVCIVHVSDGSKKYCYLQSWKPAVNDGIKKKILKAIYVSNSQFTASDIQRRSGAPTKAWVAETILKLKNNGFLQTISRRKNGRGTEHVYAVVSRDRFRVEIL